MDYLPRVLFFNAFQLGPESENQVFTREEGSKSLARILRIPLLPLVLLFGLGNTCPHPSEKVKFRVPFPTSIVAPKCFNRDLPIVICPVSWGVLQHLNQEGSLKKNSVMHKRFGWSSKQSVHGLDNSLTNFGNMLIIRLFKIHNATSQGYNLSRRIIFCNKSIFTFSPWINTISRQR